MSELVPLKQKMDSVRALLERMKPQLALAVPRHLTADRMVRVVLTEVLRTPRLLDCDQRSFAGAVIQSAQLGLEPGSILGLAYLVPFRNTKAGRLDVQLIPGYKGLLMLARRSGQLRSVESVVVHARDRFRVVRGTAPTVEHVPFEKPDPGDPVAYYAVAFLKDGGIQFEYMWRHDVEVHAKRYSRAYDDGPWVTNFDEMAQKTVLRRLAKLLPLSIEAQTAVALDERAEMGIPQDLGVIVTEDDPGIPDSPSDSAKPASKAEAFVQEARAKETPDSPRSDTPPVPTPVEDPGVEGAAATPSVESPSATRRGPGRPRKESNRHPTPATPMSPLPDEPPVAAPENGKDRAMSGHTLEWTLSALGLVETEAQLDELTPIIYGPGGLWVTGDDRTKTLIREAMRAASKRVGSRA